MFWYLPPLRSGAGGPATGVGWMVAAAITLDVLVRVERNIENTYVIFCGVGFNCRN